MESAENQNLHQREISYLREVLCEFRLIEDHTVFGFCVSGDKIFQFTRCLAEGVPLNTAFNVHIERNRIACSLLGNCYTDMSQWVSIFQHCVFSRVVDLLLFPYHTR